jgi:hypothetical protein
MYYNPKTFGAEIVGSIDTIGGYEFCMLAVFRRLEDGAMFWGDDSGCSCVSPFEGATFENLDRITDPKAFALEARKWLRTATCADADDRDAIERLIRKVRDLART